jgi:molecular chaperone DnaJ
MQKCYYEVLSVGKSVDSAVIKKAYRTLAMKYHPDRNPDNKEAEAAFKECSEAYEVLSDLQKRKIYDTYGHEGLKNSGYQAPGNFEDMFSGLREHFGEFFGGGNRTRTRRDGPLPGNDLRYDIEISFMEAVHGLAKEVEINRSDTCWTCEGTGCRPGHKREVCPSCNGRGQVIRSQGFFQVASPCPQCHGEGEIVTEPCNDCNGNGLVDKKKKVSLKIPAGVDTGAQMRLRGEGEGGRRGGSSGDLYVVIHVQEHDFFKRDRHTIYCEFPVSMVEAALGCKVDVPTIHGKKKMNISAGSQSGERYTLKREGVPSLRGGGRGDMIVQLMVKTPTNLCDEQKKVLENFDELCQKYGQHKENEGFFSKLFHEVIGKKDK